MSIAALVETLESAPRVARAITEEAAVRPRSLTGAERAHVELLSRAPAWRDGIVIHTTGSDVRPYRRLDRMAYAPRWCW